MSDLVEMLRTPTGCVDPSKWELAAADEIERLRTAMQKACDLLAERKYGSPARSPGHNARLVLERALSNGERG